MKICTVFFLLMACACSAFGQVVVEKEIAEIIQHTEPVYYVDQTGSLTFSQIRGLRFGDSLAVANSALKKLNRSRAVWVRFDVKLTDTMPEEIALRTARFARVRAYIVAHNRLDSIDAGAADLRVLTDQDLDPHAINLGLEPGIEVSVFLRVVNYSHILFSDAFWFNIYRRATFDAYVKSREYENRATSYFYVFFCGLLIFQLVYVFFQWYLMRRKEYFYYGFYILTVFFYFYNRFSVFHANLPSLEFVDAHTMMLANNTLLILPTVFYFLFSSYFVDLKTNDPRLAKQFRYFEWFLVACLVMLIVLQVFPIDFPSRIVLITALGVQFAFSVYAMVRIYRIKTTIAYFLITGGSIALLSHFIANVMPFALRWLFEYVAPLTVTMYGILLEIAIFNTGLLFKAKLEEREKVRIQRAYIAELQRGQELQTAYFEVRDKIASDLHDDIGSSLSSINIYSYAASQKLNQGQVEQANGLLKNIERSATETLASMSDLVWAINPNNDSPSKLLERVQSFAYEILAAADCRFEMDVAPAFYDVALSQAERKNMLLILKESVNNAAKYARADLVVLTVAHRGANVFAISLTDNGKGFPTDRQQGNGMRTMRKRASELGGFFEVNSRPGETSIVFGLKPLMPEHTEK